jgi:hypothetical protein
LPGGASGLLRRDYKGQRADRLVTRIDPGVALLVAELHGHERQAAEEVDQMLQALNRLRVMVSLSTYSPPMPWPPTGDRGWSRDKPTRDIRQRDGTCYTLVAAVVLVRSQRGRSSSR